MADFDLLTTVLYRGHMHIPYTKYNLWVQERCNVRNTTHQNQLQVCACALNQVSPLQSAYPLLVECP